MSVPKGRAERDSTGRNESPADHVILDRNPPLAWPLHSGDKEVSTLKPTSKEKCCLLANGQSLGTVGGAGAGEQEEPGTNDSPPWEQRFPDLRPGSCLRGGGGGGPWAGAPSELRHPSTESPGAECGRGSTCNPPRALPSTGPPAEGLGASAIPRPL